MHVVCHLKHIRPFALLAHLVVQVLGCPVVDEVVEWVCGHTELMRVQMIIVATQYFKRMGRTDRNNRACVTHAIQCVLSGTRMVTTGRINR